MCSLVVYIIIKKAKLIAADWSAQLLWLAEKCRIILPIRVSGCFLNLTIRQQLECQEIDRGNNQYRNTKHHHLDGRICLSEPLLKLLQNQLMDLLVPNAVSRAESRR
jgi:hypothetical protein